MMKTKALACLFVAGLICKTMHSQQIMPLYSDSIPNSKPAADEEQSTNENGILIISKISKPTLTAYFPPAGKANGTAVLVCPGGGYWVNAAGHEGADIAKEFNKAGITAFVLKYRIPNDAWMLNREIGPLQDAQQAIKTIRENAVKWHVNPDRIGIMGFSAGGHLASTAGTHYNKLHIPNAANTSLRPDFMILIYPVISFLPGIAHTGSAEQLLGKNPSADKLKEYSNELQVTAETPPTFLVHSGDDDVVPVMNSIAFYDSLLSKKVKAELHLYQAGGHGFGLHMKNNKEQWMERCKSWLKFNGWL